MWKRFIQWLKNVLGCDDSPPPPTVALKAGLNTAVYRGEVRNAKSVFARLMVSGALEVVRYQDGHGMIKELYYSNFPSPSWVNEIGKLIPGNQYIIKVKRDVKNFVF